MSDGTAPGARPAAPAMNVEPPPWCVGWVYLFGTPLEFQKIGFSETPGRRVREFTKYPFDVWVEHSFPVGTRKVETRLHGFFCTRKVRGEWFSLGADGVALVKSIAGARSTLSLPDAFKAPRFLVPFAPAGVSRPWEEVARGFALRLCELRVAAGLTREGLAERCGLTPWHIGELERVESPHISWHEVMALAKGLGASTNDFRN